MSPEPTRVQPPPLSIPPKSDAFVTTDEPMLAHHNHPESTVYMQVHSWSCAFYGFAQMDADMYVPLEYHTE